MLWFNAEDQAVRQLVICSIALTLATGAPRGQTTAASAVADLVQGLTRETAWSLVETVPIKFTTYHPQGMVKIGDTLFVSSVEVKVRTRGSRSRSTVTTVTRARASATCSRST